MRSVMFVPLVFLLGASLLASSASAQLTLAEIEKQLPEIRIPVKIDEDGLQQWDFRTQNCPVCKGSGKTECQHCAAKEKPVKCPECNLKRVAPCSFCAGRGSFPNPLELAICPGCGGHGWFPCLMCGNDGTILIQGGGKSGQKCNTCKGLGGIKCEVCDGKRLVPSAFRGKLDKASLKKLEHARETVGKLIEAVDKFDTLVEKDGLRKKRKQFEAIFKHVRSAEFSPIKPLVRFVDDLARGLDKPFKDIERRQRYMYDRVRVYTLFYLVHQRRAIDAAIQREKYNENPSPVQKGGKKKA